MNKIGNIIPPSFFKLKGILLFLTISTVIIGGWKIAHLDDLLFDRLPGFFTRLVSIEIRTSQFFIKDVLGIQSELSNNVITLPNKTALLMNPGCTGFKQVIQLFLILACYPGPFRRKIWYLPVSSLVLIISSMLHFVLLAVLIDKDPVHFNFFHDHLSRWLYFTIFFLAWLVWEDYVRNPQSKKISTLRNHPTVTR